MSKIMPWQVFALAVVIVFTIGLVAGFLVAGV